MIEETKYNKSIKAVGDLLVGLRSMAHEKAPYEQIYDIADNVEYLPNLILDPEDKTELFSVTLTALAKKYPRYCGIASIKFHE